MVTSDERISSPAVSAISSSAAMVGSAAVNGARQWERLRGGAMDSGRVRIGQAHFAQPDRANPARATQPLTRDGAGSVIHAPRARQHLVKDAR